MGLTKWEIPQSQAVAAAFIMDKLTIYVNAVGQRITKKSPNRSTFVPNAVLWPLWVTAVPSHD